MHISHLILDFSRVLLFSKDTEYQGSLNARHKELRQAPDYDPWAHFVLNRPLLDFVATYPQPKHILTTDTIQDDPAIARELGSTIQTIFRASELNMRKTEPEIYTHAARALQTPPEQLLYIDDNPDNLKAARQAGLIALRFWDNQQIMEEIRVVLASE